MLAISKRDQWFCLMVLCVLLLLVNQSNVIHIVSLFFSYAMAVSAVLIALYGSFLLLWTRKINKSIYSVLVFFFLFSVFVFVMSFFGPSVFIGWQRSFQIVSVFFVIYLFFIWGQKGIASVVFDRVRIF